MELHEKTQLTDPYVLILVTVAMFFFHRSKIPTSVLCRITLGTFIPSLVQIGHIVSGEDFWE